MRKFLISSKSKKCARAWKRDTYFSNSRTIGNVFNEMEQDQYLDNREFRDLNIYEAFSFGGEHLKGAGMLCIFG